MTVVQLELVPWCHIQISHKEGVFHYLVMNLMVFVIIMIMIMPGSDLVIVVAPFDQRNLTLKCKLGCLPLNPEVIFSDPCQIENTFNDACLPMLIDKWTWQALLSGPQNYNGLPATTKSKRAPGGREEGPPEPWPQAWSFVSSLVISVVRGNTARGGRRSLLPVASFCDRTGSPASRGHCGRCSFSFSCSKCHRNDMGEKASSYFSCFASWLGLFCTILYCPRSHLCLTIHPSGVQEGICLLPLGGDPPPGVLRLEGAGLLGSKGEGPVRPAGWVLGRLTSTQTLASAFLEGLISWLRSS